MTEKYINFGVEEHDAQETDADRSVSAALTPAQRSLVESRLGLVEVIASRFRQHPYITYDEALTEGYYGLIKAALNHDPTKGNFDAYAPHWIIGAIRESLRSNDPLNSEQRKTAKKWEDARYELAQSLGRFPSSNEVAIELKASAEETDRVRKFRQRRNPISLHSEIYDEEGEGGILQDLISDPSAVSADSIVEMLDRVRALGKAPLTEREVTVLGYLLQGLNQKEIADILGVTDSRVQQIFSRAMEKVQKALGSN